MQVIPISDTPAQQVNALLGGQQCQITIKQRSTGLFLDLAVTNQVIVMTNLCLDRNPIGADAYFGFAGHLEWVDTQGTNDPSYPGLGTRFRLVYVP